MDSVMSAQLEIDPTLSLTRINGTEGGKEMGLERECMDRKDVGLV